MNTNELSVEIDKEQKSLVNGGVFKKSFFGRLKDKLSNAAITLTLVGALIGVGVPTYTNAQQKNVAIVEVSKEAQDKIITYMIEAKKSIENQDYYNANILINKLDSVAIKIKDDELKNINKKLKLLLEETKRENTPIRTVLEGIQITTELGDVSYKVAKVSIKSEEISKLDLYKSQLKNVLAGKDRDYENIIINTQTSNKKGFIDIIAKKRI